MNQCTDFPVLMRPEFVNDGSAKSAFIAMVGDMTDSAESKFRRFSQNAESLLSKALSSPRNATGSLDLGVAELNAAARAQEARAIAAREIATATAAAAKAEGDYSQRARLAIAAAQALAVEQERGASTARAQAEAVQQLQAQLNRQASATDAVIGSAARHRAANDNLTASVGQQRAGMQQLSYQIADVAQGFALGVHPMMIFAQQGSQLTQAFTLMRGGAGGLAGFLGGPWGQVLVGAATVVGMLAMKLNETSTAMATVTTASDGLSGAQSALAGIFDRTSGRIANQNSLLMLNARLQAANLRAEAAAARTTALDAAQDAGQRSWSAVLRGNVPLMNAWNSRNTNARSRLEAVLAGRADASQTIAWAEQQNFGGLNISRGDYINAVARAAEVAAKSATAAAIDTSLSSGRLAAGLRTPSNGGSSRGRGDRGSSGAAIGTATKQAEDLDKLLADIDRGALAAMVQLNSLKLDEQTQRGAIAADEYAAAMGEVNRSSAEAYERQKAMRAEVAATVEHLQDVVNGLDRLGGIGSALGNAGALVVGMTNGGDYRGVGGQLGAMLQMSPALRGMVTEWKAALDDVFGGSGSFARTMGKLLEGAGLGIAGSTMVFGQRGNNMGALVGGVLGNSLGSSLGSSLSKGASKLLGGALGPLGAIAGGVLGGLVGKLFSSTKKGSTTISGSGITSSGNAEMSSATAGIGGGVQSALSRIAEALGGDVGNYSVAIGKRSSGYYKVSASGNAAATVAKKPTSDIIYNGKDEAEALRAALLNALQDGAIKGIREGSQRLLKAGKDFDAALKKAVDFESVFTRLKAYTDPVGAALDTLDKEFSRLKNVFAEAGASAEEYADLTKLYELERAKTLDEAMQRVAGSLRSLLDDLNMGDMGLSLRDRRASALSAYTPLADRVRSGDTTAYAAYDQAARTLLDLTRQIDGSTGGYFSLFEEVRGLSQTQYDAQRRIADEAAGRSALLSAQQQTVTAIDAQTLALADILNGQLSALNENAGATIAALRNIELALPQSSLGRAVGYF